MTFPDSSFHAPPSDSGSLDRAVNGEYDFSVAEIFREAWEKSAGCKGTFWSAFLVVGVISLVGNYAQKQLFGESFSKQYFSGVFLLPLTGPLYVGLLMMGVRRAAGLDIRASDVFRYLSPYHLNVAIAQVLVFVLTTAGFLLLVLPGIYLAVSYCLSAPLIADKDLQPWEAMETSRKAIGHKWWQVFGYLLAVFCLGAISTIPLGLGLIWTLPTVVIGTGILYRKIFGLTPDPEL